MWRQGIALGRCLVVFCSRWRTHPSKYHCFLLSSECWRRGRGALMGQGHAGGLGEGHVSHFYTVFFLWMLCFVCHQFNLMYVHLIFVFARYVLVCLSGLISISGDVLFGNCLFSPCPLSQCFRVYRTLFQNLWSVYLDNILGALKGTKKKILSFIHLLVLPNNITLCLEQNI